jgi:hypothetical protein
MDHPRSGRQRVHIRWLPETAPDRALIEGVFRPAARQARVGVGEASGGATSERTRPGGLRHRARMVTMSALVVALVAGPGFEPG